MMNFVLEMMNFVRNADFSLIQATHAAAVAAKKPFAVVVAQVIYYSDLSITSMCINR